MRRPVSLRAFYIALLSLLVLPATVSEAVEVVQASDSGLHGNVRSVEVTITHYSWQNGQWRTASPLLQLSETFDEQGRLATRTTYRGDRRREQYSEYSYHDTGVVRTVSIRRYDYNGNPTNHQLTEYRADGALVSDVITTVDDRITSRRTRIDLDDGYKLVLRNYNNKGEITYREETQFDTHRRVIQEMRRNVDYSSRSLRRYFYNDEGQLLTVTHQLGGSEKGSWEYSYNDNGKLREIVHLGPKGSLWSTRSYLYNSVGVLREERAEHVDLNGLEHLWNYNFDLNGNLIRQTYSQAYTDFEVETTNEHDDGNRLIWSRVSDTFREPAVVTEHRYNEFGQAIWMRRDEKGIITGFSAEFTYDSEGRIILSKRYNQNGDWQSGIRHVYDSRGNQIEESTLNADGSYQTQTTYDHEYDNHGNWTRLTRLVSNNAGEDYARIHQVTARRITYYD